MLRCRDRGSLDWIVAHTVVAVLAVVLERHKTSGMREELMKRVEAELDVDHGEEICVEFCEVPWRTSSSPRSMFRQLVSWMSRWISCQMLPLDNVEEIGS